VKTFACARCGQRLFFENVTCLQCNRPLGFDPATRRMLTLEGGPEPATAPVTRETIFHPAPFPAAAGPPVRPMRRCANAVEHDVCNWLIPVDDPEPYCAACRLNVTIPPLASPGAPAAWARLEAAKRRLLYTLLTLGLPVRPRSRDPEHGLGFAFKQDVPGEAVVTGHAAGVITINLREADDAEREKLRLELGEKFRTLPGHFRHESGHYYWMRFARAPRWRRAFRTRFGDERADYAAALARHHAEGPPATWADEYVSAYASAHPWEDWAETWAHYLHLTDALETARAHGLVLQRAPKLAPADAGADEFPATLSAWMELTPVLNEINRGMGLPDLYPFVLAPAVRAKLAFVHETIRPRPSDPAAAAAGSAQQQQAGDERGQPAEGQAHDQHASRPR
jgi:hypothetical protein